MKNTLIFIFCLMTCAMMAQVKPTGCIKQVNVPVEYAEEIVSKLIPEISYQVPEVIEKIEVVLIREKAIEEYYECDAKGVLKQCSRVIPSEYKEVICRVPTGRFTTVVVSESQVINYTKMVKIKDGYIAYLPCEQVVE